VNSVSIDETKGGEYTQEKKKLGRNGVSGRSLMDFRGVLAGFTGIGKERKIVKGRFSENRPAA